MKKSYAKVNLFLKIVGVSGNYHKIFSRFIKVKNLYDKLYFQNGNYQDLTIETNLNIPLEKNIIFKTYLELLKFLYPKDSEKVKNFFKANSIVLEKNIPSMAGLGGGSSNSATFLKMVNQELNLNLSLEDMVKITKNIGSDIPFFIYDFNSANVSGVGEIIQEFSEDELNIQTFTPAINCSTPKVYSEFRNHFFKISNLKDVEYLGELKSKEVFKNISIDFANDLFKPAINLCPDLTNFVKNNYLFSGSGSSFFEIME
jgi:4-diphosphocytidyl-2-C-methyl-D-erythritol kinase